MDLTNTLQSQNVNFIAVFTLSLELLNGLRSAAGLTQRIPPFGDKLRHRAWFYDLSSQRPPTLWARSEGSSVSIEGLHCTWGQIHTTTEKLNICFFNKKKRSHVFHCLDLAVQHIANWRQDCMACSFIYVSKMSKASIYSHCQTYRDAT